MLGVTPSEALFGCKPRSLPESILLTELQDDIDRADLGELRTKIQQRIGADQSVQKVRYDRKRGKAKRYGVGDLVMVAKTDLPATGDSRKLLPKFKGPYRVTAVLSNDRYAAVSLAEGRRKVPMVVCVDKMKPWVSLREVSCIRCSFMTRSLCQRRSCILKVTNLCKHQ